MRKILSYLSAISFSSLSAEAVTIQLTGYNHDVIAESGNGAIGSVTSSGIVRGIFTIAEVGYTGVPGQTGTPLAITNNTVTTDSGTVYSVDASANNALIGDGTLTLSTPRGFTGLKLLLYFVGGDITATLNFDDASTTVLSQTGISDWQGSNSFNAFANRTSSARRDNNSYFGSGLFMREVSFTLSAADRFKTINSIDIDFSAADNRSSIVAISGTVPEPSTSILMTSALSVLLLRRKR